MIHIIATGKSALPETQRAQPSASSVRCKRFSSIRQIWSCIDVAPTTALWWARYEPKRGLAGRRIGSPEDDGVIRVIRRQPPIFEPAAYSASFA
jgi:hypothetical protein